MSIFIDQRYQDAWRLEHNPSSSLGLVVRVDRRDALLHGRVHPARLVGERAARLYLAYQVVLSLNFVLTTICTLPFLAIIHSFGVLVVTMENMVTDVFLWGGLFVVILIGYIGRPARAGGALQPGRRGDVGRDRLQRDARGAARHHAVAPDPRRDLGAVRRRRDAPVQRVRAARVLAVHVHHGHRADQPADRDVLRDLLAAAAERRTEQDYRMHQRVFEHQHVVLSLPPPFNLPGARRALLPGAQGEERRRLEGDRRREGVGRHLHPAAGRAAEGGGGRVVGGAGGRGATR